MEVSESPALDIGHIVKLGMSVENISAAVAGLSRGKKSELLFRHVSPPIVLPATYSHGCNRRFNPNWLQKYA